MDNNNDFGTSSREWKLREKEHALEIATLQAEVERFQAEVKRLQAEVERLQNAPTVSGRYFLIIYLCTNTMIAQAEEKFTKYKDKYKKTSEELKESIAEVTQLKMLLFKVEFELNFIKKQ